MDVIPVPADVGVYIQNNGPAKGMVVSDNNLLAMSSGKTKRKIDELNPNANDANDQKEKKGSNTAPNGHTKSAMTNSDAVHSDTPAYALLMLQGKTPW